MQISAAVHNLFTQLHRPKSLILSKVFVGRPLKMIIPSSVANGIQNDALKAMIVLHRPLDLRVSRHLWHHFCSIVSIQSYKFRDVALMRNHIVSFILIGTLSVLHLMSQIYQVGSALGAPANFHAVIFLSNQCRYMNSVPIFVSFKARHGIRYLSTVIIKFISIAFSEPTFFQTRRKQAISRVKYRQN